MLCVLCDSLGGQSGRESKSPSRPSTQPSNKRQLKKTTGQRDSLSRTLPCRKKWRCGCIALARSLRVSSAWTSYADALPHSWL